MITRDWERKPVTGQGLELFDVRDGIENIKRERGLIEELIGKS